MNGFNMFALCERHNISVRPLTYSVADIVYSSLASLAHSAQISKFYV